MSFTARLQSSRNELLWLVTGKDKGKQCWYYVLVDKPKLALFKKDSQSDFIQVNDYGEILYSGWGDEPPQDIKDKIKTQYG